MDEIEVAPEEFTVEEDPVPEPRAAGSSPADEYFQHPMVSEPARYPRLSKVMEGIEPPRDTDDNVDPNDLEVPAFMRRGRVLQLD